MLICTFNRNVTPAILCALVSGLSLLTSCTMDTPVLPSEEIYTREFIKTFGVIDAGHDFNMASRTTLTVTSASPADVKVYADVSGTRYLFGTFLNVSGTCVLSVDVPQGASSLVVKSGSRTYTTAPGGTVDLDAAASRSADDLESQLVDRTVQNVSVTSLDMADSHSYLSLDWDEIESFNTVLPEKSGANSCNQYSETNLGVSGVAMDFLAKAKTFWLFPMYWDTDSYETNKIGVYYYVDEEYKDCDGVVAVDYRTSGVDSPSEYVTKYIVRKEIYDTNTYQDNLKTVSVVREYTGEIKKWSDFKDDLQTEIFSRLMAYGPDKYQIAGENTHYNVNTPQPKGSYVVWRDESWGQYWETMEKSFAENVVQDDIHSVCPDIPYVDGVFCSECVVTKTPGDNVYSLMNGSSVHSVAGIGKTAYEELRSYGIRVDFDRYTKFGFYIEYNRNGYDLFYYSEKELNEIHTFVDEGDVETSYVATFINPGDPYDSKFNDKRYLLFEDWPSFDSPNFDLNDMVFRVYGFDRIATAMTENIPEGGIMTVSEDLADTSDPEPFEWIIACEDLGTTDDFDFNDIVFAVGNPVVDKENNTTTVDVTALAAGGTLEAYILYDGAQVGEEFHKWFGDYPVTTMVNTSGGSYVQGETVPVEVGSGFSLSGTSVVDGKMGGFSVMVVTSDGVYYEIVPPTPYYENGSVSSPQMLCLPGTWVWPLERHRIDMAYPDFKTWVGSKKYDHWAEPGNGESVHIYQGRK